MDDIEQRPSQVKSDLIFRSANATDPLGLPVYGKAVLVGIAFLAVALLLALLPARARPAEHDAVAK
jgi:hypothetical protein